MSKKRASCFFRAKIDFSTDYDRLGCEETEKIGCQFFFLVLGLKIQDGVQDGCRITSFTISTRKRHLLTTLRSIYMFSNWILPKGWSKTQNRSFLAFFQKNYQKLPGTNWFFCFKIVFFSYQNIFFSFSKGYDIDMFWEQLLMISKDVKQQKIIICKLYFHYKGPKSKMASKMAAGFTFLPSQPVMLICFFKCAKIDFSFDFDWLWCKKTKK